MRQIVAAALMVLGLLEVTGPAAADPRRLLAFQTMFGVQEPFLGNTNAIRGVEGDELPWEIVGSARGTLDTDGHLKIRIRGLVFGQDPSVPPELRGKNDETAFRAIVSCLTVDAGQVIPNNLTTEAFPATPTGNSNIDATVKLPNPCVAPIVFVIAGSELKWFAVTGVEEESE